MCNLAIRSGPYLFKSYIFPRHYLEELTRESFGKVKRLCQCYYNEFMFRTVTMDTDATSSTTSEN